MTLKEWEILSPEKQEELVESLQVSPYTDRGFFKEVEIEFIKQYGNQPMIGEITCSFGPGLGPYNCISVEILPGKGRSKLPKRFLGFMVVKRYQRKGSQPTSKSTGPQLRRGR